MSAGTRRSSRIDPSSFAHGRTRAGPKRGGWRRGHPAGTRARRHSIPAASHRVKPVGCRFLSARCNLSPQAGKVAAVSRWLACFTSLPQSDLASAIRRCVPTQEVTHEAFATHAGPGYRGACRVLAIGIQRQPRRDHARGRNTLAPGRDDVARPVATRRPSRAAGSALVAARRSRVRSGVRGACYAERLRRCRRMHVSSRT
jgi:hypothetical protein